jgi:hypothetical protein
MKITMISQKEPITTEDEIVTETTVSKWLNFLGTLLVVAGMIIWFIILGRCEADILDGKQILILCTLLVVCIGGGIWFELKSQRHREVQTFQEYIHEDFEDYDRLQDDEVEDCEDEECDYDYLQDGDAYNTDFPDEGQGRKGGTYYGNE